MNLILFKIVEIKLWQCAAPPAENMAVIEIGVSICSPFRCIIRLKFFFHANFLIFYIVCPFLLSSFSLAFLLYLKNFRIRSIPHVFLVVTPILGSSLCYRCMLIRCSSQIDKFRPIVFFFNFALLTPYVYVHYIRRYGLKTQFCSTLFILRISYFDAWSCIFLVQWKALILNPLTEL